MAGKGDGPLCRVGTSGWHYAHWRGRFYPADLATSKWLSFYAAHFSTVELNNSFYRLPSEHAFASWRRDVPAGFVFAVKASRLITHFHKLAGVEGLLANFMARAGILGPHLGPVLYQLPPNMRRDEARLEAFLRLLPFDVPRVFEFRDPSWLVTPVFALLERYRASFCVSDMRGVETPVVVTANPAYFRFHGSEGGYYGSYSDEELQGWARRIAEAARGVETVYAYFNNDAEGFAVRDAERLSDFLMS